MRISALRFLFVGTVALACTGRSEDRAREQITSALSDTLGKTAEPSVGFLNNRQHLQVSLSSTRFEGTTDSAFAAQAKEIARFTLSHYELARTLDSITVLDREPVSAGMWRMRHVHAFAVGDFKGSR